MENSRFWCAAVQYAVAVSAALLVAGCVPPGVINKRDAVDPNTIAPIYIPTTQYDGWSCPQLAAEIQKTNTTIADMGGKLQRGEYDNSGSLIVTPLFLMYDNTPTLDETPKKAQEFARLKGTLKSLQEASAKVGCAPN